VRIRALLFKFRCRWIPLTVRNIGSEFECPFCHFIKLPFFHSKKYDIYGRRSSSVCDDKEKRRPLGVSLYVSNLLHKFKAIVFSNYFEISSIT